MDVEIEYWDGSLPLRIVKGGESLWDGAQRDGIVRIYIRSPGHLRPEKTYTMILVGSDFYYLEKVGSDLVFGGWTDPSQPWAVEGESGSQYLLTADRLFSGSRLAAPPMRTDDSRVGSGAMLPEEDAREIGLID